MLKLSHTAVSKYQTCGRSYQLQYRENWYPRMKGSPLYFGSAMDTALNYILENKDKEPLTLRNEAIAVFDEAWTNQTERDGSVVHLPSNTFIKFSDYDYDSSVMQKEDWARIFQHNKDAFKIYDETKGAKDNYLAIPEEKRLVRTLMSWLSLRRKGHLFVDAYINDILPFIDKVLQVQQKVELQDGETLLSGYIDALVTLNDGRTVVLDNKTSSVVYSEDSVAFSAQLALYKAMLETLNPELKIDGAAYAVLSKKLVKDTKKVCKVCSHVATGSHKTCNNEHEVDGKMKRCGGEWDVTTVLSVATQFITDNIDSNVSNMILENVDQAATGINSGQFSRNLNACEGKFGRCDYFEMCWKNNTDALVKKEKTT